MSAADANINGVWTGLLKWSLAQPNYGSNPNDVKPLTDEEKAFLSNVFDNLVVDEVKRMKIVIGILQMPEDEPGLKRLLNESATIIKQLQEVPLPASSEQAHYGVAAPTPAAAPAAAPSSLPVPSVPHRRTPSPSAISAAAALGPVPTANDYASTSLESLRAEMISRKQGALEELDDRAVGRDVANDFIKLGGIEPLLICMLSEDAGIRWRAAQAISTIVQNNEEAQKKVYEQNALQYLVPLLTPPSAAAVDSSDNWTVVVKALTALSALCRADALPQIRTSFLRDHDGLTKLCALLSAPGATSRVQTKVFLLLLHVIRWFAQTKDTIRTNGVLATVITEHLSKASTHDINHRESVLKFINEYLKPTGTAAEIQTRITDIIKPHYNLKSILQQRLNDIAENVRNGEEKEMFEEEEQLIASIKQTACEF